MTEKVFPWLRSSLRPVRRILDLILNLNPRFKHGVVDQLAFNEFDAYASLEDDLKQERGKKEQTEKEKN